MTHVLPAPTETEAAYLASLGSSALAPSISPQQAKIDLQDFFRLCRLPWVADFIFSPDMTSLPALTAPANIRSAVSCSVQISGVQCVAFGDHPFDFHLTGGFIFVPSFSVAEVSVGFGVQECVMKCFAEWCSKRPDYMDCGITSHIRFVRDDAKGVFIIIHKDPRFGAIKMELMSSLSASVRRRSFAVFDERRLLDAVHTDRGILHSDSVISALKMISTVVECKKCPHCGSPPSFFCNCKLDTDIPKHPLDFSVLRKNMSAFVGAYEGLARNTVFVGGKEVLSGNVGTVIQIDGGVDDDLITRLSCWAITDQLKGKKENPVAFLMPASGGKDDEDADVIDMAIDGGDIMAQGSVGLLGITGSLLDPVTNISSSCSSGSGILISESLEDTGPNEAVQKSSAIAPSAENVSSETGPVALSDEALDLVKKITGDADLRMDDLDLGGINDQCLESLSSEDNEVPNVAPLATCLEQQMPAKVVTSRTRSIAPSAPVEHTGEEEQDDKDRRAQLRKQRNREAAQRSNMKRKIKNDTLKKSLKESHAKAAELRARELALREENLQLRKLTSS